MLRGLPGGICSHSGRYIDVMGRTQSGSSRQVSVFDLHESAGRMIEARLKRENPAVTAEEIRAAIRRWASGGDRHLDADGYLREIPIPQHFR